MKQYAAEVVSAIADRILGKVVVQGFDVVRTFDTYLPPPSGTPVVVQELRVKKAFEEFPNVVWYTTQHRVESRSGFLYMSPNKVITSITTESDLKTALAHTAAELMATYITETNVSPWSKA